MTNTTIGKGQGAVLLVGRILITAIFLASLMNKIQNPSGTMDQIGANIPFLPPWFWYTGALILIGLGGLSLLLGIGGRIGAWMLALFVLTAGIFFHNFWAFEGQEQQMQMIHFMKNISILGGTLAYAVFGTGPLSIDRLFAKNKEAKA